MTTLRNVIPISAERAAEVVAGPGADIGDGALVEKALGGDRWAEQVLFRRHYPPVVAKVTRLLGDREEADDVVQETFVTALTELPKLREPDAFRGWLLRIAVSKVHRVFRRRRLLSTIGLRSTEPPDYADLASADASPEVRTELSLLSIELARLGPAERIAWTLRHVEGHKLEEVAAACECSLATAKRRIATATKRISEHVSLDLGAEVGDE